MKKSFLKASVASLAIVFASYAAMGQEATRASEKREAWNLAKKRITLQNEDAEFKKEKLHHQFGAMPEPALVRVGETLVPVWEGKYDERFVNYFNKRLERVDEKAVKRNEKAMKAYYRQIKRIDRKYDR